MAESSKQNPEKLFNFKITPLNKFKLAIDALCERDFNPIGFGVIEVTEDRVDFTARNVDTNDAGQLVLNSTALQDFLNTSKCKNRIMRVNFRRISQIITVAESCNVDSITIFHIEGTNRVNFNFGNNPVIVNTVMLLPMAPGFEKFPDITLSCEAIIPSEALRAMINRLERIGNQLVLVEITEKVVKVLTGENQQPWEFKFDDQVSGFRGTSPGQKHRAWFKWPHLQMLKIASHTTEAALICFLTEPKNMIMTRFTLREVGHLVFINKAIMIDPGFDLCYNKGETSNPSGESSHAIQNTITTETEQGIALVCVTKETDCGEINRHALQSEHNHIPQGNNVRVNMKRNNITLEMLQPFWSNHTKLVDAAEELGVSRFTLKQTIKELGVEKWPRKGRKQQPDAKKRKTNNTAPFESYCSQQNVVNLGSSAAHTENVQCIMGSDLHLEEPLIESHMDIQQQVQGHLEGALHTTESSGTIVVKATYKELSVRIVFSLTLPINQLIEEIGMKFQLELNKYRLLYQDEDKEWMMLTSVEDLKYASDVAESLGTKFVRLSVID